MEPRQHRDGTRSIPPEPDSGSARARGRPLREVISQPAVACGRDTSARVAAQRMSADGVSALVVLDDAGGAVGLVTERDLVTLALATGQTERPVRDLLPPPVPTVAADDLVERAVYLMARHGATHLLVTEGDRPIGLVTVRDLLRAPSAGRLAVARELDQAATPEALVAAFGSATELLFELAVEGVDPERLGMLAAELADRLVSRGMTLTLARLSSEGLGVAPPAFTWLTLGSGGRCEQVLPTDQDSALVYADPSAEEAEAVRDLFLTLGARVVALLARAGFAPDRGGVMASEPRWCLPLSGWAARIQAWAGHPEPFEQREANLFLDFRGVGGDERLAEPLRDWVIDRVRGSPQFLRALVADDADVLPPLTRLGRLRLQRSGEHRGRLDLKNLGTGPVAGIIRALALRAGIRSMGTLGRLRGLVAARVFSPDEGHALEVAFRRLWSLRIRLHLDHTRARQPLHNFLDPRALLGWERQELKAALREVGRLQARMRALVGMGAM